MDNSDGDLLAKVVSLVIQMEGVSGSQIKYVAKQARETVSCRW